MRIVNRLHCAVHFRESAGDTDKSSGGGGARAASVDSDEFVVNGGLSSWHTVSYLQQGFPYVLERREGSLLQFTADKTGKYHGKTVHVLPIC